jgi:hypothetical protein
MTSVASLQAGCTADMLVGMSIRGTERGGSHVVGAVSDALVGMVSIGETGGAVVASTANVGRTICVAEVILVMSTVMVVSSNVSVGSQAWYRLEETQRTPWKLGWRSRQE